MSDQELRPSDEEELGPESKPGGSAGMRALLKRSLAEPPKPQEGEILLGVQRKIRKRSRGKFYGDGWSTANARMGYGLVAGLFLVVLVLAYAGMTPGFSGK
jgi:hypothetical protein